MASPGATPDAKGKQKGVDKNESTLPRGGPTETVIWPDANENVTLDAIVKFGKDVKAG